MGLKIGISGHGGAGKDEAGKILAESTTLRYVAGTSKFAEAIVYERWGYQFYPDVFTCWQDRRSHRQKWAEIIGEFNRDDPVALYRRCLANQDMLTGIRYGHEFRACKAAGLVDLWIWIERDVPPDPTMEYTKDDCDFTIENNGDIASLTRKLLAIARAWNVVKH